MNTPPHAETFITLSLGYLSARKPVGVNNKINGNKIKPLTTAVNKICVSPSYALNKVF